MGRFSRRVARFTEVTGVAMRLVVSSPGLVASGLSLVIAAALARPRIALSSLVLVTLALCLPDLFSSSGTPAQARIVEEEADRSPFDGYRLVEHMDQCRVTAHWGEEEGLEARRPGGLKERAGGGKPGGGKPGGGKPGGGKAGGGKARKASGGSQSNAGDRRDILFSQFGPNHKSGRLPPWNWVGPTAVVLAIPNDEDQALVPGLQWMPHHKRNRCYATCIWAHPVNNRVLRLTFSDVPETGRMDGYVYFLPSASKDSGIRLTIRRGSQEVGSVRASPGPDKLDTFGFKSVSGSGDLVLEFEGLNTGKNHACVDAVISDASVETGDE